MTSFIYQPEPPYEYQQLNVISSMNRDSQDENVLTAKKSAKRSLVLQQSTSKLKRKTKETNRDMGLTYSSKVLDFDGYDIEKQEERKDRSLKIDCSGPADIVADIQNLDYEYVPKKKEKNDVQQQNAQQQKVKKANAEPKIAQFVDQKSISQIISDVDSKQKQKQNSEALKQSWDVQQQLQKKIDLLFFIFLLLVLIVFLSHATRKSLFETYAKVRQSIL